MTHELRVLATGDEAADAAADFLAATADAGARSTWALSGGKTPQRMFARLAAQPVPWSQVEVFQVDERVAPDGDDARNATHLEACLGQELVEFHPMDVTADDLEAAARRYEELLPERFDVVHLGLGPDGHTASLVPDDPVLDVRDRRVAVTNPYEGYRRLTVTFPVLDAARLVVWLVAGEDKREALTRLLDGDTSIPGARVRTERSIVFCDRAAR